MSIAAALVLLCACLWPQGQQSAQPTTNAASEQAVRRLMESLPPGSMWRDMLGHGARGGGIRQPWMDEMRSEGIKLAELTFEFDWTQGGKALKDWALASASYFPDYDYASARPIMDPRRLKAVSAGGLEGMLGAVALAQAKQGVWFEYPGDQHPPRETGTGYRRILLADNEWLPVQMFPLVRPVRVGHNALDARCASRRGREGPESSSPKGQM